MTLKETGRTLDSRQLAFNDIVEEAQKSFGRDIAAVFAFRPKELLIAFLVSTGWDLVRGNGKTVLVQLPKLFEGEHEKEYLLRSEFTKLMNEENPANLNIYFFYQIHALKYRLPVCLVGVKRKDESMDRLRLYGVDTTDNNDLGQSVTLGEPYPLSPVAVRLPSGETLNNTDQLLKLAYGIRFQPIDIQVNHPSVDQVWNR